MGCALNLWSAERAEARPTLAGDRDADVAIVGAGYTGLWTALLAKSRDPDRDVVVLEGRTAGWAASGRNGGFVTGWWDELPSLIERHGPDGALAVARAVDDAVDEVGRRASAEGIDCDYAKGGTITLARSQTQLRRIRSSAGFVDAGAARAICGASRFSALGTAGPFSSFSRSTICATPRALVP